MANTITQNTLRGNATSKYVTILLTIVSDGSEETDLVIYDNSALINNVARGSLMRVQASGAACQLVLEWDQTTDSPIVALDPSVSPEFDFSSVGGVHNPNGTGATGDIVLSTAGLDSGDVVTLLFTVNQG